ncbi:glycosyltransferase family 8 protein [Plicaturopsis crispa FD-325 SS-3]|nr:glycosyltransferase family 8 protein [Plicaturopsis crispa FD-325 SS-3]
MEESKEYTFTATQDWFSHNVSAWRTFFPLVTSACPRVLEIGSWEGRSAVFLLNNLCKAGGEIVCIDHFDLMHTPAGIERYAKVRHNLSLTGKPHRIIDDFSVPALMTLLQEEMSSAHPGFDWIYVDGSHEADDTLLDGELVWRLARKGAIVIFDDYLWDKEPADSMHHPRRGIDAFMTLHRGQFNVLSSASDYQMVLQKTSDMRIGFLVKGDAEKQGLAAVLDYGINVAFAVDCNYAMPAAVAIRSAVQHTQQRMNIYVVDAGLSSKDREMIKASVPLRDNLTLMFLELPDGSLAKELGACWAKLDLIKIVPVERVLYLDADLLVRSSLADLWATDLQGRAIGAVIDMGHPVGYQEAEKRPYYNAGVLLMDLAKIREGYSELGIIAKQMAGSRYKDQDVLNAYFAQDGGWFELDMKWNGQGLGTYADQPSADRQRLLARYTDPPSIVHFTGPVHPGMDAVLDPYNQPYTAKPWGYAEGTEWRGLRESETWRNGVEAETAAAIQAGSVEFRKRVHASTGI